MFFKKKKKNLGQKLDLWQTYGIRPGHSKKKQDSKGWSLNSVALTLKSNFKGF